MDLYQILVTHNRAWTVREIICFSFLFLFAVIVARYLVRREKIAVSQAVAGLSLMIFLGIVFGSTVFTRAPMERKYELALFWSWREVFLHHNREILKENLLNCVLLFPVGVLLPFVVNKKISWKKGFFWGLFTSALIETSQLVFCRGLFELDDIVHNSIGCMMGCIVTNLVIDWIGLSSTEKGQEEKDAREKIYGERSHRDCKKMERLL